MKTYNVYIAPAQSIMLGRINEVTRRSIIFSLSKEKLSNLLNSKTAYFQINSTSTPNHDAQIGYPIIIKIDEKNMAMVKEFEKKCINKISQGNLNENQ